jgi:DNA-binding transcriptional ArsR family regulator
MTAHHRLTVDDLAQVRFAPSPMWEVVTSWQVLRDPGLHPVHGPWFDQVRPRLAAAGLLTGRLAALMRSRSYIPDFLNPPPADAAPTLAGELAAIVATPEDQLAEDLDVLDRALQAEMVTRNGGTTGPAGTASTHTTRLRTAPDQAKAELATEITHYWDIALAPYWSRIRTLLEADVFHRARQMAEYGAVRLFDELHPDLSWNSGTLQMLHRQRVLCRDDGAPGLILVPSAFAWGRVLTRAWPGDVPQLCYGARGVGTVFTRRGARPSDAVAAVIGRSRALLLAELAAPASTTELAERTGMSAGGVSEHLTALRGAGMVSAHRAGRSVLYARTAVADSLLAAAV